LKLRPVSFRVAGAQKASSPFGRRGAWQPPVAVARVLPIHESDKVILDFRIIMGHLPVVVNDAAYNHGQQL